MTRDVRGDVSLQRFPPRRQQARRPASREEETKNDAGSDRVSLTLLLPAVPLPRVCLCSRRPSSTLHSTWLVGVFQRRQVVGEGAAAQRRPERNHRPCGEQGGSGAPPVRQERGGRCMCRVYHYHYHYHYHWHAFWLSHAPHRLLCCLLVSSSSTLVVCFPVRA